MEIYVGTSGWLYDWNEDGTLDWFIEYSGLNAVELNASFYRFPFRNQVLSWARKGTKLRWVVKVHRSITHLRKLSVNALETWFKFYDLFKPLDNLIDFYLFQLPPNFTCSDRNLFKIKDFYLETQLGERFALEFRHSSCFNNRVADWARNIGLTLVSIDAPIGKWLVKTNRNVYLRLHGREVWYGYDYSLDELRELAAGVVGLNPERLFVFFNNNHWMLGNARTMLNLLKETVSKN